MRMYLIRRMLLSATNKRVGEKEVKIYKMNFSMHFAVLNRNITSICSFIWWPRVESDQSIFHVIAWKSLEIINTPRLGGIIRTNVQRHCEL